MAEEQKNLYEVIYDMGSDLVIAKVRVDDLKEQDINARIMNSDLQDRLTENIRKRGQLESLPLVALVNDKLEIVSGHHRIKSARAAELKEVIVILDISGLTRSQVAAKQLAHNAIEGFDDESALREICKMITDIDDMMESAINEEYFKDLEVEVERLATPSISYDFKLMQFTFLPHQFDALNELVKRSGTVDCVGVADISQFEGFVKALEKVQRFHDVKAVGAAVHLMTKSALNDLKENGFGEEEAAAWVPLSAAVGGGALPAEAAAVIKQAIDKAEKNGDVTKKNRWQLLEYLCADYLGRE